MKNLLEYELILHGWEYEGQKAWDSDQWLRKGIKHRLDELMHVYMDEDDETNRDVWHVCRGCRWKVGRLRWGTCVRAWHACLPC